MQEHEVSSTENEVLSAMYKSIPHHIQTHH
jgi:hypothetical protein